MKHSKEVDAQLQEEAIKRAYADPSTFTVEGQKDARPAYLPEDINEYTWLLDRKYITKAIILAVVAGLLALGWVGFDAGLAWYKQQQELNKQNAEDCAKGGPTSYACAGKNNLKERLGI